jgi:ABC-2 type transport system permease protein
MPPLRPGELMLGLVAGGVTRGLLVALAVTLSLSPFVSIVPAHPLLVLYYAFAGALMMALLGLLGGLWAEKFDQMAALTNFLITPLSFLSGTFYAIAQLPGPVQVIAHLNPFFYLIDGMRYGFTGHADGAIWLGMSAVLLVDLALWLLAQNLIARGWRLKA